MCCCNVCSQQREEWRELRGGLRLSREEKRREAKGSANTHTAKAAHNDKGNSAALHCAHCNAQYGVAAAPATLLPPALLTNCAPPVAPSSQQRRSWKRCEAISQRAECQTLQRWWQSAHARQLPPVDFAIRGSAANAPRTEAEAVEYSGQRQLREEFASVEHCSALLHCA